MESLFDESLDALVAKLQQEDSSFRREVVWEMEKRCRAGDPLVVPLLIDLLNDADWQVQEDASDALWSSGERALPSLIEMLRDTSAPLNARMWTARTLAYISDSRTVPPLIDIVQSDNEDATLRSAAMLYLGQKKDARALEPLAALVTESSAPAALRADAAAALAKLGDQRAVKPLRNVLSQKDIRYWRAEWERDLRTLQEMELAAPEHRRTPLTEMLNQFQQGRSLHEVVLDALRELRDSEAARS